jgi:hypothetical protein
MDARPPRGPAPSAVRRSSKSARSSKYTEKRKHGVWLSSVSRVHFPPTEALTFRTLASRACGPGRRWTPGELAWAFLYGAWRTADLPFAPGHKSRLALKRRAHLSAAMLAGVEAAWPYCRDLRILVEAPDSTLGASCIAWLDATTHAAAIEPLGVPPRAPPAGTGWRPFHACGATYPRDRRS